MGYERIITPQNSLRNFPQDFATRRGEPLQDAKLLDRGKDGPLQLHIKWEAWLKLNFFLHAGPTEVSGMAITSVEDPLAVDDFVLIKQKSSPAFTAQDPDDLARYMVDNFRRGIGQDRTMKLWWHTHPVMSPHPSGHDEQTFATNYAQHNYRIMFILARQGDVYCRLTIKDPLMSIELPVVVQKDNLIESSDKTITAFMERRRDWVTQYLEKVTIDGCQKFRSSFSPLVQAAMPEDQQITLDDIQLFDCLNDSGTELSGLDLRQGRYEGWDSQAGLPRLNLQGDLLDDLEDPELFDPTERPVPERDDDPRNLYKGVRHIQTVAQMRNECRSRQAQQARTRANKRAVKDVAKSTKPQSYTKKPIVVDAIEEEVEILIVPNEVTAVIEVDAQNDMSVVTIPEILDSTGDCQVEEQPNA